MKIQKVHREIDANNECTIILDTHSFRLSKSVRTLASGTLYM